MISELITNALLPLNLVVEYENYKGKSNKYVLFSFPNERDTTFEDDEAQRIIHDVNIMYYCVNLADFSLNRDVKRLMKESGFLFIDGGTRHNSDGLYAYELNFAYIEYL